MTPITPDLLALINMPDLCLLAILEHLPIRDLLRTALTCRRLRHLTKMVAKHKTSLSIFGDVACIRREFFSLYVTDYYQLKSEQFDLYVKFAGRKLENEVHGWDNGWVPMKVSDIFIFKIFFNNFDFLQANYVITADSINHLAALFPNITSLAIYVNYFSMSQCAAPLLAAWPNLIELKLVSLVGDDVNNLPALFRQVRIVIY